MQSRRPLLLLGLFLATTWACESSRQKSSADQAPLIVSPQIATPGTPFTITLAEASGTKPTLALKHSVTGEIKTLKVENSGNSSASTIFLSSVPQGLVQGDYTLLVNSQGDSKLSQGFRVEEAGQERDLQIRLHDDRWSAANEQLCLDIDRRTGRLRIRSAKHGSPLLESETIRVGGSQVQPLLLAATLEEATPYYARLRTRIELTPDVIVERIIELTDGPNVFVTVYLETAKPLDDLSVSWELVGSDDATVVNPGRNFSTLASQARAFSYASRADLMMTKIAYDLKIQQPKGLLGGLDNGLSGMRLEGETQDSDHSIRDSVVSNGRLKNHDRNGESQSFKLKPESALVFGRVFSVADSTWETQDTVRDNWTHRLERNPFYAGWGMLSPAVLDEGWTFANWNNFQYAIEFTPLPAIAEPARTLFRDQLIRMSSYFIARLQQDGGWPKWFAWNKHPEGTRFTAHARAFPFAIYLFGWLREAEGRDTAFEEDYLKTLQSTMSFFDESSQEHFVDVLPDETRYLGYATSRGVFHVDTAEEVGNTHSHAYKHASLMYELSKLAGDNSNSTKWEEVLNWADQGTQHLFQSLYPALDKDQKPQWGLIGYRTGDRSWVKSAYNEITLTGFSQSMKRGGKVPLSFIDVVERTTQDYRLTLNEGLVEPRPERPFLGSIYRALPLSLAYAEGAEDVANGSEFSLEYVSLNEVLIDDRSMAAHDPSMVVSIDEGITYSMTNRPFLALWTRGHFEEVSAKDVEPNRQFRIEVIESKDSTKAFWAAENQNGKTRVSANFEGKIRVHIAVKGGQRVSAQNEKYKDHHWAKEPQKYVGVNSGSSREMVAIELDVSPKDVWTFQTHL